MGRRKKKLTNEVVAIVATGVPSKMVSNRELFTLWQNFHRQICIYRGPGDQITIFGINDQRQDQLLALLPFMPAFEQRRVVLDEATMKKLDPEQA